MTGLETQLETIQNGAAFAHITDRAFLRVSGPDATRWLNGMVTNSVQALTHGQGCYTFLLNAQGRIQGDCTLYCDDDAYLLETDHPQLDNIQQMLDRFIIMDDVELTLAMEDETSLLLLGPQSPAILQQLALPLLQPLHLAHIDTPHGPILLLTPAPASVPFFELRGPAETMQALCKDVRATEVTLDTLEAFRIFRGQPRYGTDILDRDLPQETAQTQALHFSKGCYLGQEIVERIHSRGKVHRIFSPFTLTGTLPELPAPLEANGKPAGELTSAVQIGDTIYALGYARREALDTHATLTYAGGEAVPSTKA